LALLNQDGVEGEGPRGGCLMAEEERIKPEELRKLLKRREEKQEEAAKALAKV